MLNVSRKLGGADTRTFHAYPAVVLMLGKCTKAFQLIVAALYSQGSSQESHHVIQAISNTDKVKAVHELLAQLDRDNNEAVKQFMKEFPEEKNLREKGVKALLAELRAMPFYQLQGYSLGRAWASPISGDTVFSVLIGGCVTAMHGHFAMHAGQLVQWYFSFEAGSFSNVHTDRLMVGQRVAGRAGVPEPIGAKRQKLQEPLRENFCVSEAVRAVWAPSDKRRVLFSTDSSFLLPRKHTSAYVRKLFEMSSCLVSFCLLQLSFSPPAPPPSPREPCAAASSPPVSHASRKRRFSSIFSFSCRPSFSSS